MLPTNPYVIPVSGHVDRVSKKMEFLGPTSKTRNLQGFARIQVTIIDAQNTLAMEDALKLLAQAIQTTSDR